MKQIAACFTFILSLLLFTTTFGRAAEKKIIFNTESIEYKSGTGPKRCQDLCNKRSGPDANSLVLEGWKIVNSSPQKVVGEQYRYVPCPTCSPHGCTCIGTEYLLQKDDAAPKVETSSNELDVLKNEKDVLKQEIILLKREIELLKKQIKSNQTK
ncbi:MAG: hypothetical protein AB9919_13540 [Geobacteraceae bacterium]